MNDVVLNGLIYVICIIFAVRTFNYGIWTIKKKNYTGGIVVMLLSTAALTLPPVVYIFL